MNDSILKATSEFARRIKRACRSRFDTLKVLPLVPVCRYRYDLTRRNLASKAKHCKIRVLFLVNETAKWKAQSLYDRMLASGRWDPVIGRTIIKTDALFPKETVRARADELKVFFERRGMRCEDAGDFVACSPIPLESLSPDIVFYQQPWGLYPCQFPAEVSKFALACYIPYYVEGFGNPDDECRLPFHRLLYLHFLQSETWADVFRKSVSRFASVQQFVGTGHTMLDQFRMEDTKPYAGSPVIYSPHWSFSHPKHENTLNLSTFLWTGRAVLEYAKSHPSIKWAFRPHPALRRKLSVTGAWTQDEVDHYYAEWKSIGEVSYTGDYTDLFKRSKAMVTDCESFLAEYPTTGKPLIRLDSPDRKLTPMPPAEKLLDSLYTARNLGEMHDLFDSVLLRDEDPLREKRLESVRSAGLIECDAAGNILRHLENLIGISHDKS